MLLLTPPSIFVSICQSVKSCHCAQFWHSQKTPTEVWPLESDQINRQKGYYGFLQLGYWLS